MELFPKPPPCTSMYYTSIPEAILKTSAKSWRRSSSSYGDFFSTIPLQQIEERLNSIATNTEVTTMFTALRLMHMHMLLTPLLSM